MTAQCPGRLALCGHPCGCDGRNPSHYPDGWRTVVFREPPDMPDDPQEDQQ